MSLHERPRLLICGTGFGRVYLAAFDDPTFDWQLVGVLARGSDRSRAAARHYGVPLFTSVDAITEQPDVACVVIRSELAGGRGSDIARDLLRRGVHVLQDYPVHLTELVQSLRVAREGAATFAVNSHYVNVDPVGQFIRGARHMREAGQRPIFVDADAGLQVVFPLLDILGRALGAIVPFEIKGTAQPARSIGASSSNVDGNGPFSVVTARIAGVAVIIKVQNEVDPDDPDGHFHVMHRVSIGFDSGTLTLLNTHGPIVWTPKFRLPPLSERASFEPSRPVESTPSASVLDAAQSPSFDSVYSDLWPRAVRNGLEAFRQTLVSPDAQLRLNQYQLELTRVWQELTATLGPPRLIRGARTPILAASELRAVMKGANGA